MWPSVIFSVRVTVCVLRADIAWREALFSELPNPPALEEHGQVAVLADLEYRPMERGGQAGQGSCA